MPKALFTILSLLFFLQGCGGGGGFPLRQSTVVKSTGIHKIHTEKPRDLLNKQELLFWNGLDFNEFLYARTICAKNHKYKNPIQVDWQSNIYEIACSVVGGAFHGGVGLFDSNENLILHLETPRYATGIVAFQLTGQVSFCSYLAICVKHQTTSRSATLFVLDENFVIIYKEYPGDVDWAGKGYEASVMYLHISNIPGVYKYSIE
jgi:hypothetical protein